MRSPFFNMVRNSLNSVADRVNEPSFVEGLENTLYGISDDLNSFIQNEEGEYIDHWKYSEEYNILSSWFNDCRLRLLRTHPQVNCPELIEPLPISGE